MSASGEPPRRIPTATAQLESAVIAHRVGDVWDLVHHLRLAEVSPQDVVSVLWDGESGGSPRIGSTAAVEYVDGSRWRLRVTGIVEYRLLEYELIEVEPEIECDAVNVKIRLAPVTETGHTMVTWITVLTNQANLERIEDIKYKKLAFFGDVRRYMAARP